jgi:hypothetical protein
VIGQELEAAAAFPTEVLLAALQAPLRPSRVSCANLALSALQGAIARFRGVAR